MLAGSTFLRLQDLKMRWTRYGWFKCSCSPEVRRAQNFYCRSYRSRHLLGCAYISTDFVGCTCLCCRTLTRSRISLLIRPRSASQLLVNYLRRSAAKSGSIRERHSMRYRTFWLAWTAWRYQMGLKIRCSNDHANENSNLPPYCCQVLVALNHRSQMINLRAKSP